MKRIITMSLVLAYSVVNAKSNGVTWGPELNLPQNVREERINQALLLQFIDEDGIINMDALFSEQEIIESVDNLNFIINTASRRWDRELAGRKHREAYSEYFSGNCAVEVINELDAKLKDGAKKIQQLHAYTCRLTGEVSQYEERKVDSESLRLISISGVDDLIARLSNLNLFDMQKIYNLRAGINDVFEFIKKYDLSESAVSESLELEIPCTFIELVDTFFEIQAEILKEICVLSNISLWKLLIELSENEINHLEQLIKLADHYKYNNDSFDLAETKRVFCLYTCFKPKLYNFKKRSEEIKSLLCSYENTLKDNFKDWESNVEDLKRKIHSAKVRNEIEELERQAATDRAKAAEERAATIELERQAATARAKAAEERAATIELERLAATARAKAASEADERIAVEKKNAADIAYKKELSMRAAKKIAACVTAGAVGTAVILNGPAVVAGSVIGSAYYAGALFVGGTAAAALSILKLKKANPKPKTVANESDYKEDSSSSKTEEQPPVQETEKDCKDRDESITDASSQINKDSDYFDSLEWGFSQFR